MEASTKKLIAVVLTVVMMSSVVGMVGAQELRPQADSSVGNDAAVSFSDQTTDGTSVTVDSVNTSDGGFVVIHNSDLLDGEVTGSVIGVSEYLEPGLNENVTVTLFDDVPGATFDQTELTENETLIAMPHRDTNANETYDFVATNGSEDDPYVANGTAITDSANVTVETPVTGESFAVTGLTAPEVIEQGDTLNVSASVENPNDEADTQTVEYRFNGTVLAREQITLDAGESTSFEASVNTSAFESDGYIHGVYTREDGQPAQVLIVDEIVSFDVTALDAPESVTAGDNVTVNATVYNPNDFAHEQPIEFRFDGALVETRNVDLNGENSTEVQFRIDTEGTPPGTYIQSVFSNDFGQDAIITIEAPDDESPTDGDDGEEDDGDEEEDGEDGSDGDDSDEEEDGEDGSDGDDGEGEDGEDGSDGDDGEEEDGDENGSDEDDMEEDESEGGEDDG